MVFPGMVYISHPTEYGTLYSHAELSALSDVCRRYGIPLFMDGARLGYGLMSKQTDLSLPDIADLCEQTPLYRIGDPAEVAELVYFLSSEKASFITAQIIGVDGGFGI